MYQKLTRLSFIIGLFFLLLALILFGNGWMSAEFPTVNRYTAVAFLLFGILMMVLPDKSPEES